MIESKSVCLFIKRMIILEEKEMEIQTVDNRITSEEQELAGADKKEVKRFRDSLYGEEVPVSEPGERPANMLASPLVKKRKRK